jgi:hypothetical protein
MADVMSCNELRLDKTELHQTRIGDKSPVKSPLCSSPRHPFDVGFVLWLRGPQPQARQFNERPRRPLETKKATFLWPMGSGRNRTDSTAYAVRRVIFCIHSHHFCLIPNEDPASHPRHE